MFSRAVYLEAPQRTQDLLNLKWTLLGAGCVIGSTWHDDPAAGFAGFERHWRAPQLAEMDRCETLVVVASQTSQNSASLAAMAGMALAKGMKVVWIGPPVEVLRDSDVRHFATAAEFEKCAASFLVPARLPVAA